MRKILNTRLVRKPGISDSLPFHKVTGEEIRLRLAERSRRSLNGEPSPPATWVLQCQ